MEWGRDSYEGLDFPRLVFLAITSKFCRGLPWACVFSLIWLVAHATEAFAVDADILVEETRHETTDILFYLPYPKGSAYRVIQGPEGQFSHYGLNRWATDFEMPEGTPVCATAAGKVVCVQQRFTTTGVTTEARTRANRIIIDHGRGLFSQYLHLKPGQRERARGARRNHRPQRLKRVCDLSPSSFSDTGRPGPATSSWVCRTQRQASGSGKRILFPKRPPTSTFDFPPIPFPSRYLHLAGN